VYHTHLPEPLAAITARQRRLVTVLPAVMPLAMWGVFAALARRLGPARGYQAGFAIYWAVCWTSALALVGPERLAALWRRSDTGLPRPRAVAWTALITPAAGAFFTRWLPNATRVDARTQGVALAVGVTNALAEEALWRGAPAAAFPTSPVRGWLWPAAGFTAWHLVPLAAASSPRSKRLGILLGAGIIGLGNGWIAWRSQSLVAVAVSHLLTDSCGLSAAQTTWLDPRDNG
jgi:membrane protease YdiL (CAAX protease family)